MPSEKVKTGGLVTEARPIPWDHLSTEERALIDGIADPWIEAVVEDSGRAKPGAHKIDEHRTGRVLFIDGVRGAGKTSFLLTVLEHWMSADKSGPYQAGPCNSKLRIFLPVLDFDPLPRGMPLHGWLLEPWRKMAQNLDKSNRGAVGGVGAGDLTEQFAELFERAVLGWTPAHHEGKGVVDKALAYQERSSGWLETYGKWSEFVGAMVCKHAPCPKVECDRAHEVVFVLAIDDVDLQVEHLPDLLHAIRLFHHPNVAYVLTGDYEHLRFALLLDYIGRHDQLLGDSSSINRDRSLGGLYTPWGHRGGPHITLWNDINRHSKQLRDAFLEKALPRQSRLRLEHLSLAKALEFRAGDGRTVEQLLPADQVTLKRLRATIEGVSLVTARRAQQAADELLAHIRSKASIKSSISGGARSSPTDVNPREMSDVLKFFSTLCRTSMTKKGAAGSADWCFMLQGEITTRLGTVLRSVKGRNRTTLLLAERPRFVLRDDPNTDEDAELDDADAENRAHQALLVQLLVEEKLGSAPALAWAPDAGILATEVEWEASKEVEVKSKALFHWPTLVRPAAADVVALQAVAEQLNQLITGATQAVLEVEVLSAWLSRNLAWFYNRSEFRNTVALKKTTWEKKMIFWSNASHSVAEVTRELYSLAQYPQLKEEVESWVRELLVTTAPYFGLPDEKVGKVLRAELSANFPNIKSDKKELQKEQHRVVKNAIMAATSEPDQWSSDAYEEAAKDFIKNREQRESTHSWWNWLKARPGPTAPKAKVRAAKKSKRRSSKS